MFRIYPRIALVIILYVITLSPSWSQVAKFGKVNEESLKMDSYPKDSSAAAVVLFDVGDSKFYYDQTNGFQIVHTRHRRVKIFKKEAYDLADIEIPFYDPRGSSMDEKISNIKGATFKLVNGKVEKFKLDRKDIFNEEVNENWEQIRFTLPQVTEGAIFEYSYELRSDFVTNLPEWFFQDEIPIVWSEYSVMIPEYFTYGFAGRTFYPLKSSNQSSMITNIGQLSQVNTRRYFWAAENVPAFKNEKFITTPRDFMSHVRFQLQTIQYPNQPVKTISETWTDIARRLDESDSFGKQLMKSGAVKDIVEAIRAKTGTSIKENISMAYQYLQENIKWNEKYGKFTDLGIRKTINEKEGSVGDINLSLILILRELGIQAYPVLLSTRQHGYVDTVYPSLERLNYVVCAAMAQGKMILLDATSSFNPMGQLPAYCLSDKGLLIKGNQVSWIPLSPKKTSNYISNIVLELNEEGDQMSGIIQTSSNRYVAVRKRAQIINQGEESFIEENWTKKNPGLKIKSHKFSNLREVSKPFKTVYEIDLENEVLGDRIYLSPFINHDYEENPFKQENRKFPVDFAYPIKETYIFSLKLPETFVVEELAKSQSIVLPDRSAQFIFAMNQIPGGVQAKADLVLLKPVYSAEEYEGLKQLFSLVVDKFNQQIVLKKDNSK